jgi:hypothetical protein
MRWLLLAAVLPGCSLWFGDDDDGMDDVTVRIDAAPVPDARELPDATPTADAGPPADASPCAPEVRSWALSTAPHVEIGVDVAYTTNPPSSGPHWPKWARWNRTYDEPELAEEYWVHNLEHGAVVLLYRCEAGGCGDVRAQLEAFEDSLPVDPKCVSPIRTRTLVARYPGLPVGVSVAAAAWGATYAAGCLDEDSLRRFYVDHVGQGPEDLCNQGSVP